MQDEDKTIGQLMSDLVALRQRIADLEADHKEAERSLRESAERYRAIVEAFDGLIYICSQDYRVKFMNKRFIERTGYDPTGELCYRALHNLDSACTWCVNERVFKGETVRWEIQSPKDNRWYYVVNTPIYHPDGSVSKQAMILDITERKKAEEELRESEEKYRLLVMNLPSMVFRGYNDWSVEFIDRKVESLTGYDVNEFNFRKMKWSDIVVKEDVGAAKRIFIKALKGDKSYVREYRIMTKAGEILWIQERGQILCAENGEIDYIDGVFFDITDQKKTEEALRESSAKLKLFAYSVIHDLKSPAIGIHGLTERLHRIYRDRLDDRGKSYCDQIVKASVHVAALIEKINDYIATKESPLTIERINMKEILQIVRDEFSPRLTIRQIDWREPQTLETIRADKLSIIRVFRNFVDNALKYGGDDLSEISIGHEESDDFHILSVSDNGAGIKGGDFEGIFGVFRRDELSKVVEGTGLGLAIVREIAERHGGRVWAEPRKDTGTAFHISISKEL